MFPTKELQKAIDKIVAFKPKTYQERDAWVRRNMGKGDEAFDALCRAAGRHVNQTLQSGTDLTLLEHAALLSPSATIYRGIDQTQDWLDNVKKTTTFFEPGSTGTSKVEFAQEFATGQFAAAKYLPQLDTPVLLTLTGPAFPITKCALIDKNAGNKEPRVFGGKEYANENEQIFDADEHFLKGTYDVKVCGHKKTKLAQTFAGIFDTDPVDATQWNLAGMFNSPHVPMTKLQLIHSLKELA